VRGVPGRSQGPGGAAVHARVRVETCARLLLLERAPRSPMCRQLIQHIERVFW
jgi:hypothetical protein